MKLWFSPSSCEYDVTREKQTIHWPFIPWTAWYVRRRKLQGTKLLNTLSYEIIVETLLTTTKMMFQTYKSQDTYYGCKVNILFIKKNCALVFCLHGCLGENFRSESYMQKWAAMWTLETEPRLTAPTEDNALSCCDISPDAVLYYTVNRE